MSALILTYAKENALPQQPIYVLDWRKLSVAVAK